MSEGLQCKFRRYVHYLFLTLSLGVFSAFPSLSQAEFSPCDDMKTILKSSVTDFKDHRTGPQFFNLLTIWNTDLMLAGQECQVWQWGVGNYSFVCTRSFPMKEAGKSFVREATNKLKSCFSTDLDIADQSSLMDDGIYTRIRSKTDKRRIDIFLAKNSGLFKDSWTFYFMVTGANGYPLKSLEDGIRAKEAK